MDGDGDGNGDGRRGRAQFRSLALLLLGAGAGLAKQSRAEQQCGWIERVIRPANCGTETSRSVVSGKAAAWRPSTKTLG
jgi:hypothetical protein